MKKLIKRVTCFFFAVLVLCVCFPFSAFAVDPVSAGVMANAFAQAIAAYGAANGAAMTFDVSSTSSIGETVHELWADFRAGTQDADDYETLAAALFPDLYYKAVSAAGTAAEAATIGYNISSEYAEEFDNFWNWLLSGPAEMTKVDNQYFQFDQAQIGASSVPIILVGYGDFSSQPIPGISYTTDRATLYANASFVVASSSYGNYKCYSYSGNSAPIYVFDMGQGLVACSSVANQSFGSIGKYHNVNEYIGSNSQLWLRTDTQDSTTGLYYNYLGLGGSSYTLYVPEYTSLSSGLLAVASWIGSPVYSEALGVKAASNTGVASFPDTADPNYEAVAKRIPSDVPWDDSLFGDGTGTMTDAQSQAAAETADDVIERDKTLPLAGDQTTNPPSDEDPPSSDPDDYMVLGLEDVFPFCIPFDIYNFLAALSAAPVAPHFVCTLDFPDAIGGEQTIDIDFDTPTFNQLAQLLRTLELLAFIVGLALLTRSMFIRG